MVIKYGLMSSLTAEVKAILRSKPDPLGVRRSTAAVMENARFVTININQLKDFGTKIALNVKNNQLLTQAQFGKLHNNPQKIFLLDTVNFCFWARKSKLRWAVAYPAADTITQGWQALVASFDRAIATSMPILDSQFLARISLKDTQRLFQSHNQTQIPLLKQRQSFLQQAGQILNQDFAGDFNNLIKLANHSAPQISRLIIKHFPCFNDTTVYRQKQVKFFKRAQICAYDLSLLSEIKITHIDQLTFFADYRLPQMLRTFGVLEYQPGLAEKVDHLQLIIPDSQEELEIRASTVWAGELLAYQLNLAPAQIDNAIWFLAKQTQQPMKPHHQTLTTNY